MRAGVREICNRPEGAKPRGCPNIFLENFNHRYLHVVARPLFESSSVQYKHVAFQSGHGIGSHVNCVLGP